MKERLLYTIEHGKLLVRKDGMSYGNDKYKKYYF